MPLREEDKIEPPYIGRQGIKPDGPKSEEFFKPLPMPGDAGAPVRSPAWDTLLAAPRGPGVLMFNNPTQSFFLDGFVQRSGALPPVTPGERFAAEWEDMKLRSHSISESSAWYDAYERVGEQYEKDFGKPLVNPFNLRPGPERDAASRAREKALEEARAQGRFYSTDEDIREQIARDLQISKDRADRARAAPQSWWSEAAGMAGRTVGAMADPALWPTLFVGAGSTSILRGAAIEAAIGAGTELPIQLKAMQFNERYGIPYSADEVIENTLFAAGGAAGIYGGLRLGARGLGLLVRRAYPDIEAAPRPVRDALNVVEAENLHADLRPGHPLADGIHERAVARALDQVAEGAPVTVRTADLDAVVTGSAAARLASQVEELRAGELRERPAPLTEADLDRLEAGADRALYRDVLESVRHLEVESRRLEREAPQDLTTFLVRRGGLQDENALSLGGDIRQMLGRVQERPGLVNNQSGLDLDEAAQAAWEAGYLRNRPNADERPTPRDLLDALREDFTGEVKHYPAGSEGWQAARAQLAAVDQSLNDLGIVWRGQTEDSIVSQLREVAPRVRDLPGRTLDDLEREWSEAAAASTETPGATVARRMSETARKAAREAEERAPAAERMVEREVRDIVESFPAYKAQRLAEIDRLIETTAARVRALEQSVGEKALGAADAVYTRVQPVLQITAAVGSPIPFEIPEKLSRLDAARGALDALKRERRQLLEADELKIPVGIDEDGRPIMGSARGALEAAERRVRDSQAINQCVVGAAL